MFYYKGKHRRIFNEAWAAFGFAMEAQIAPGESYKGCLCSITTRGNLTKLAYVQLQQGNVELQGKTPKDFQRSQNGVFCRCAAFWPLPPDPRGPEGRSLGALQKYQYFIRRMHICRESSNISLDVCTFAKRGQKVLIFH